MMLKKLEMGSGCRGSQMLTFVDIGSAANAPKNLIKLQIENLTKPYIGKA